MRNKLVWLLTLFVVIPIASSCGSKTYYFNFYGDNCAIDGQSEFHTKINLGDEDLTFQLAVDKNYILPKEIETGSPEVTYDSDQGIIKISEVKGDVTVSATAEHGYSHFSFAGVNCAINNQPIYNEDLLTGTKDIVYYVKPFDDYVLPAEIDGIDGTGATYNKNDGSIHIPEISSDITLAAVSKYKFQFTFFGENCVIKGDDEYSSDLIEGEENIVFTIKPCSKYLYPDTVTISGDGAANASYDKNNGSITISKVIGSVEVKAIAKQQTEEVTFRFDPDNGSEPFHMWTDTNTPLTPPANPTKKDKIWTYTFLGWYRVTKDGTENTPFDFNQTYTDTSINLIAKWSEAAVNQYKAYASDASTLAFTTMNDQKLVNFTIDAGSDFHFKMKVIKSSVSNDIDYVVPSMIDIFVDGNNIPLSKTAEYDITPNEDETQAEVTIHGDKVTGNINISSEGAVLGGQYNYEVKSFGLKSIESGTHNISEPLQIKFEPDDTYALPKAENIYVYFDGIDEYVSPEEGYFNCTYDSKTGTLAIASSVGSLWIKNNIKIFVRANNYDLLNKSEWEEISSYGERNYAQYMFYVGEKKAVNVFGHAHLVMIIGFHQDMHWKFELYDEEGSLNPRLIKVVSPITFQFYNIITKKEQEGKMLVTSWNKTGREEGDNFDYSKSKLNTFLNNTVYDALPEDLQKCMKGLVSKKIDLSDEEGSVYDTVDYTTKLFPLSINEMTATSSEAYTYYKTNVKDYARAPVGGDFNGYWTRSPAGLLGVHYRAWRIIYYNGKCSFDSDVVWTEFGVVPAFCI